jgi:hypothetical protein
MAALTGACLSIDWPPTVESGHGGGGGSAGTAEAGVVDAGEDTSFDANGITGFICLVPAANNNGLEQCSTFVDVLDPNALLSDMNECRNLAPQGTVLAQGAQCPSGITGCCQRMGADIQQCYYTMNAALQADTTETGCESSGGVWSTTPIPYQ